MTLELAIIIAGLPPAALGAIAIGMRVYFRRLYEKLSTQGRLTKGTVVGIQYPQGSAGRPPQGEIKFVATDNYTYTILTQGNREWKTRVGKPVTIAYDPRDPHKNVVLEEIHMIENFIGPRAPIVLLIIGVPAICLGAVMHFMAQ